MCDLAAVLNALERRNPYQPPQETHMGIYAELPGARTGKAQYLHERAGATVMAQPKFLTGPDIAVCVVKNDGYEAAALAATQEDFDRYSFGDFRPRIWLSVPRASIKKFVHRSQWEDAGLYARETPGDCSPGVMP